MRSCDMAFSGAELSEVRDAQRAALPPMGGPDPAAPAAREPLS